MHRSSDSEITPPAPAPLPVLAPPPTASFFRRNRRLILTPFWITLVLSILITLFTAPTYQAVSHVTLPSGANVAAERTGLSDAANRSVITEFGGEIPVTAFPHRVKDNLSKGPSDAALAVESDNPEAAALGANAWAQTYAADVEAAGRSKATVTPATVPDHPIRPKKAQQILFGGFVGLSLGFLLAFLRDLFRNRPR